MTGAEIREALVEINEDVLFADGFDDALVGCVEHWTVVPTGGATRAVAALYDRTKCIEQLMTDSMSVEEAEEFFEFNVAGAYVGEATPVFATLL